MIEEAQVELSNRDTTKSVQNNDQSTEDNGEIRKTQKSKGKKKVEDIRYSISDLK
jgi:hypothetical protein